MLPIPSSGKREDIDRLNKLIDEYNSSQFDRKKQTVLLNQIHVMATDLFRKVKENHNPSHLDKDVENYLFWYYQNPVASEFKVLGKPAFLGLSAEKSLMELSNPSSRLPDVHEWTESTTPLRRWKKRGTLYQSFDPLLKKAQETRNDPQAHYELLSAMKHIILHTLNDTRLDKKPVAQNRLRSLMYDVNAELNATIEKMADKKASYTQHGQIAAQLLGDTLYGSDKQAIIQLAEQLNMPSAIQFIPGFTVKKLGGITCNNKNWLAENPLTGEQYVIRLMDGILYKPQTLHQLYNDEAIARFLVPEHMICSAGYISKDKLEGDYVISVTDFCSQGDLCSHQQNQATSGADSSQLLDNALDKSLQIADFIQTLATKGYCHPDIKADNFLIANNGQIVTSDLKFIRKMENGYLDKNTDIATTYPYAPPEYLRAQGEVKIDMDKFASYQLAVMLYDLATAQQGNEKLSWLEKLEHASMEEVDNPNTSRALNFDAAVFKTDKGAALAELIKQCLCADPLQRPSLIQLTTQLQALQQPDKLVETTTAIKQRLDALKQSTEETHILLPPQKKFEGDGLSL